MSWKRHLKILLATFGGLNAALYLFVLAMNPFGNLPSWALPRHEIMDTNQRYQYPSVVRSGRYDSIITGTSTSRLFEPPAFERVFGGRFANVSIDAGTAWEQAQIVKLFLRHAKAPLTLVLGVDHVWCSAQADSQRITFRGFPEWLYDDNPWNDLAYMYNIRAIEIAGRRVGSAFLGKRPRIREDGYEVFTPPESAYDIAKVNQKLYGNGPRRHPEPKVPPEVPSEAERAGWRFPALEWLQEIAGDKRWQRIVFVSPPVHVVAQARPGTIESAREIECRDRVARIARANGVAFIDFRIPSSITREDTNYWDPLHYRVGIAERVAVGLGKAIATAKDDPAGDWVMRGHVKAARAD